MRMRTAYEEVKEFSNPEEQLDESLLGFLRTGAIAINTKKSIESGKKIKSSASKLKTIANRLQREDEPEKVNKLHADAFETIADLFIHQEEMIRRHAYLTASGSLFSDSAYKLLRKMERKRR